MARPRAFNIDDAVEAAMNVFWEHGYQGASIPDLLAGMGLTRGSLYKAFGSKKALFLQALSLYEARHVEPAIALLRSGKGSGAERISRLFETVAAMIRGGDRRGCLLCNSAAGPAFSDPDIACAVNAQIDAMTDAFGFALADDSVGRDDPTRRAARARNLTLTYVGVRVLTRGGSDVDWLTSGVLRGLEPS